MDFHHLREVHGVGGVSGAIVAFLIWQNAFSRANPGCSLDPGSIHLPTAVFSCSNGGSVRVDLEFVILAIVFGAVIGNFLVGGAMTLLANRR